MVKRSILFAALGILVTLPALGAPGKGVGFRFRIVNKT
jgi:hypothetical protein